MKIGIINKILLVLAIVVLSFAGNYYLRSKFRSGECVQALDGYIWHINNYNLGKYYVMGWQDKAWGMEQRKMSIPIVDNVSG